jgi:hypothetical protein
LGNKKHPRTILRPNGLWVVVEYFFVVEVAPHGGNGALVVGFADLLSLKVFQTA